MTDCIQDLRFALRGWRQAPGFAIAAIGTLALAIGANTAIFSLVSGVLLRPLPFSHPEQLVQLSETQPRTATQGGFDGSVVSGDLAEWRAHSRLLAAIVPYSTSSRNLQTEAGPEQVAVALAEHGLFDVLGVPAVLGRAFRPGDPPNVAVASYAFWTDRFGDDPSIAGRTLTLDGQPFTLIGVMPKDFQFPYPSAAALWLPSVAPPELRANPNRRLDSVLARLQPATAPDAARQELNAMSGPSQAHRIVHVRPLKEVATGSARQSLLMLLGAVGMVLLVACVNVANLLLARTASRNREIAIRAALGASRLRLLRQFLTESLLLAFSGGIAGLGLGLWGSRLLTTIAAHEIPRARDPDWRLLAFLLAVCTATAIAFGLAPALTAARGGARALHRRALPAIFRDTLVVVEIALAFILLSGAGLLLRTFLNLQHVDTGFHADDVLTVHVVVSGAPESLAIEQRVAQLPGVRDAGLISLLPLQYSNWSGFFRITPRPDLLPIELRFVTPGYFRAMGIPLRAGREFSSADSPTTPRVILVNEALARQYFPGENPIGRATDRGQIVGVVGDVRQQSLSLPAIPEIYNAVAQNFAQIRGNGSTLVVHTAGPATALAPAIRAAVLEVSPAQALFGIATMRQVVDQSLASPRLYLWLLALFAAMGTLLAVAGIHAVVAYLVAQRTREFGIRIALGADTARVLRLVMNRGALLVASGLLLGVGGAAALTKVLRGVLYGVAATDPLTFAAMACLLASVALAACLAPARRASRVDPSVALRAD